MPILTFYLLACLPVTAAAFLCAFDRRVNWWEWIGSSVFCFALAGLFQWLSFMGQTHDIETWSGQLTSGRHVAAWDEYYEYAVYRYVTDSKGNVHQVFDHWQPTTCHHDDEYGVQSNIDTSHSVSRDYFNAIAKVFGGYHAVPGDRVTFSHNSRMIGGDPNDYVTEDKTGYIWPVTKLVSFTNRVKATPSTFSYEPVPPMAKVFAYPANNDPFASNRLLGTASALDRLAFDQLNARLGPAKRVNVILCGFGDSDSMAARWQEAAWVGGKKNDVVICWGGSNQKPTWVRAFGWTDSKTCLRYLESIVLEQGMSEKTLPLIEQEVHERYRLKDWDRAFAHISIPAAPWAVWTYFAAMLLSQVTFWFWADREDFCQDGSVSEAVNRCTRRRFARQSRG